MKQLRRRWWVVLVVALAAAVGFITWAANAAAPTAAALAALNSDEQVTVEVDEWLVFQPRGKETTTGLVIYPGGRVDYRAYAPLARRIAAEGFLVVIVPMPLNLAVFAPERALDVRERYERVTTWAIAGHSLGGAMAANLVDSQPQLFEGLALWAAYPAESDDLSDDEVAVVAIYGTLDGLATVADIEASRKLLPPTTEWIAIEGGNHAQFGWYGPQRGDNGATIDPETQQQIIVEATAALLRRICCN